ncbi:MAG: ATP-dependent protease subunit HslV [Spirochaetia bacterium]|nr:ATP-dependent protease subunit HslV [Spirochaetia bacterium]MCF7946443.1 ATP-dependent protease subunit HslV [Spirochaetia bacterium]
MSFHGTTILAVKRDGKTAMAGDGQVTLGNTIIKGNAKKIRKLYDGKIMAGFAGATADAFTLLEKFEGKVKEHGGDITRAAVEVAKEWRMDKALQKLEAMMLVADKERILLISGTGDVLEPEEEAIAIGSGGTYALASAKAYIDASDLAASEIALRSLKIASSICIYTNNNILLEEL